MVWNSCTWDAGYNNVDIDAAVANGITVVRVPAYSPYAVAEYTVALCYRSIAKSHALPGVHATETSLYTASWDSICMENSRIIGTGKIAKILIHSTRGSAWTYWHDVYPDYNFARENQVVYTSLDELYHSADIISGTTARSPNRLNISSMIHHQ